MYFRTSPMLSCRVQCRPCSLFTIMAASATLICFLCFSHEIKIRSIQEIDLNRPVSPSYSRGMRVVEMENCSLDLFFVVITDGVAVGHLTHTLCYTCNKCQSLRNGRLTGASVSEVIQPLRICSVPYTFINFPPVHIYFKPCVYSTKFFRIFPSFLTYFANEFLLFLF